MRPDLHLNMPLVESCWIEIDPYNHKAHILEAVYIDTHQLI